MQSRVKQFENRIGKEIEEKEGLLQDIEKPVDLKITPMKHHKELLIKADNYGISYVNADENSTDKYKPVFQNFNFELRQGERIFLHGKNGCGKSSFIKAILDNRASDSTEAELKNYREEGTLSVASGLIISYINQDTSFLQGRLKSLCEQMDLDEALFYAILRQLDMERVQFTKNIEDFSEGQKKKVLIAASLLKPAHLYIWDEPLNYIDVFSRMQIEKLILDYQPTMLIVEHDVRFREKIASRVVEIRS